MQALENHALDGSIVEITDVPNDQGKKVRIVWNKFADDGVAVDPIKSYTIKRFDEDSTAWTGVGEHTADSSPRYALVVPTLYDSTADGLVETSFKVVAVSYGGMVYESDPAQGYSVDNLAPAAPEGLMANTVGNQVQLTWNESLEKDFNYFAIYRSTAEGFDPAQAQPIATLTSTEYLDSDIELETTYYYKISAFDFSGNESDYSDEVNAMPTGVSTDFQKGMPDTYVLQQNFPNPFNPTTSIQFGIPENSIVKISIYDIRGVFVRTLANGKFSRGWHSITWNGLDERGISVSAGTYIYRLESRAATIHKKMIFLK
jgi:hypothetical protein